MIEVALKAEADFAEWRDAARKLLMAGVPPETITWRGPNAPASLFQLIGKPLSVIAETSNPPEFKVPKAFVDIAARVICNRDPERFARLYRILWTLQSNRGFLGAATDPDIIWMAECDKAVRRDRHKMHAFVRFRKVGTGRFGREQFAAWFEPSHFITELATPFFMRRFPNMDWIIVTPECTAAWDGKALTFGPGGRRRDVPADDSMEEHWKVYFRSIFNPARLKVGAMMSEMPKKYWHNMPEAADIPDMVARAQQREQTMRTRAVTAPHALAKTLEKRRAPAKGVIREYSALEEARASVQSCKLCPLYQDASQAVFGEGPRQARIMIVGEQPGDEEDIAGRPFIGPAGKVLDAALKASSINRDEVYVTNAVKHFKFKARGKRRIHERPSAREIDHCRWWLDTERQLVKPDVIIALGVSSARSILGKNVKISDVRGKPIALEDGSKLIVTAHPAYILRLPNPAQQEEERRALTADISTAMGLLSSSVKKGPHAKSLGAL